MSVNDKHGVTVVYLDFSRAFDTVTQRKLIEARLTSTIAKLLSGIIQGSGVGPLLF